jgi:hypothetical protein
MKPIFNIVTALGLVAISSISMNAQSLTWASKDVHYQKNAVMPQSIVADTTLHAWRGERVNALALVKADSEGVYTVNFSGKLSGEAHFVDYVLTDMFRACGKHPTDLEAFEVPDIIDSTTNSALIPAGELRPVWVTIEVPRNAKAGKYVGKLSVNGKEAPVSLTVDVADKTLPQPADQAFHLNLWQQPYAVSRYYGVEPWSKEHFELLKPYAQILARADQRTISAILFYEPWGEQSNDLFLPMVETTRHADGTWSYNYDVFDRWVSFMDENGVGPIIECFTMIPWEMSFRYFDEQSGDYATLKTTSDAPEYRELWSNFLRAFGSHLREKGWFERAVITMDERSLPDMLNAYQVIADTEPQLKVALHGNYHPELIDKLYSCSLQLGDPYPAEKLAQRRSEGKVSCLYTCCTQPEPNIFSNNAPADAAWLPVYCTATGHDGYLHWSWMNWTDDPMHDSRFKLFAPGDTYFIYPDARSSVRFERLIEGIQLSEKVRLLREKFIADNNASALATLDDALIPIRTGLTSRNVSTADVINNLSRIIDQLSENIKK